MIKITDDMKDRVNKAFEEKKYCVWVNHVRRRLS